MKNIRQLKKEMDITEHHNWEADHKHTFQHIANCMS